MRCRDWSDSTTSPPEARLTWLVNDRQSTVTNVVDVALQEFFDRCSVPPADHDGRITEQES